MSGAILRFCIFGSAILSVVNPQFCPVYSTRDLSHILTMKTKSNPNTRVSVKNPINVTKSNEASRPEDILKQWFSQLRNESDISGLLEQDLSSFDPRVLKNNSFLQICRDDTFFIETSEPGSYEPYDLKEITGGDLTVYAAPESNCQKYLRIQKISGCFSNGNLEDVAKIYFYSELLIGNFHRGVLHGWSKRFRCKIEDCFDFLGEERNKTVHPVEIVRYSNGKRVGHVWKFKVGGGTLFGKVDLSTGNITDDKGLYLYPDKRTGLMGKFRNDVMIRAETVKLTGLSASGFILIPVVVREATTSNKVDLFRYQPANNSYIPFPLLRDPYEDGLVFVGKSQIGEGRGVFSKVLSEKGKILCFYQGIRTTKSALLRDRTQRKSTYKIDNDWAAREEVLDIPKVYRSLNKYNATLCHLVNHSPHPNSEFTEYDHPRFGKIRAIRSIKPLQPGEELAVDYGYIRDYFKQQKSYSSLFNFGRMFSEASSLMDYQKDLKKHIRFLKKMFNEYEPYFNLLLSFQSLFTNKNGEKMWF